jgi:hypothetical protein
MKYPTTETPRSPEAKLLNRNILSPPIMAIILKAMEAQMRMVKTHPMILKAQFNFVAISKIFSEYNEIRHRPYLNTTIHTIIHSVYVMTIYYIYYYA